MSDLTSRREFPEGAAVRPGELPRRDFIKLLGASIALAGLDGCVREPDEAILSYVDTPADAIPGVPRHYATAMTIDGYATGIVVESNDGRPTKIEGNPDHPASLGGAGIFEQAAVLQLYDRHRAKTVRGGGRSASWASAVAAFSPDALKKRVGARGAGLRLLLEPTSSPLVAATLNRLRERYPDSRAYFFAPLAPTTAVQASRTAFGIPVLTRYDFTAADVVVSFGADVLATGPCHLRWARDFSLRRRTTPRSTLFVAEASPSPTGSVADHRIAASPTAIARLVAALSDVLADGATAVPLLEAERAWVTTAVGALSGARGRSIVVVGNEEPADVHVLVHALNATLGNVAPKGTVEYAISPIVEYGSTSHDLPGLVAELTSGDVDTLVMLQANPCYGAPADLEMSQRVRAVRNSLYLGLHDDETARASSWHVPAAHFLESWGDTRAYDGTESIVQPLIAPLYGGRTVSEMLALLAGVSSSPSAHDLVRAEWDARRADAPSAEARWEDALRRGVVDGTALPAMTPTLRADAVAGAHAALRATTNARGTLEIAFTASRAVHDGRFANNAWLQELPDAITKLTWDNAALTSPMLATKLGLVSGDVIELRVGARTMEAPVLVVPGQADDSISLAMGYGRSGAEAIARDVGVNVNLLRTSTAPYHATGVSVRRTGRHVALAVTQGHWSLEGRDASIIPTTPPSSSAAPSAPPRKRRPLTLYEPPAPASTGFGADQWAMTIDLDQCTGCGACVVACQAENNTPTVGKDGVLASREMHWMRIDRYVSGTAAVPTFETQPMLCQHCEKAPCEYVCPVDATVHSDDGLNEMVYNRCVGTRFCSNNCPYKVRRFNWFDYNDELTPVEQMVENPQVTVRERGVMEKCTFCVQRVRRAQRDAESAGDARTGTVQTACQQTCPSQAIVFGSLTAPNSEVARLSADPRAFSALDELGTVPRVRYLSSRRDRA